MAQVLVIDSTFRPIRFYSIQKAARDLALGKSISGVELGLPGVSIIATFRTPTRVYEIPSVLVLKVAIKVPKNFSKNVTNTILFARDNWTCQYCGTHKNDLPQIREGHRMRKMVLTRDHIIPKSTFRNTNDANTWDNVTTACEACNNKKDNKLPNECGMHPINTPKTPSLITIIFKSDTKPSEDQIKLLNFLGYSLNATVAQG